MSRPIAPVSAHSPRLDSLQTDKDLAEARAAAEGMEALFIDYLMQQMRKTVPKDEKNPFNLDTPVTEIYQGMMDSALAEKSAHSGGIGLADRIVEHLLPPGYTQNRITAESRREPYENQPTSNQSD